MLDILSKVAGLTPSQQEALGLQLRDKANGRLRMPGYEALNDLLNAIDPLAYARAMTGLLQAHARHLPRSLALDSKNVGDGKCGMIVTLCRHEDGRPVAMIVALGKKEDCEVSEDQALLADALVTAEPLHTKQPTVDVILNKGNDDLIATKGDTCGYPTGSKEALRETPFAVSLEGNHGRFDVRQGALVAISPVSAGLRGMLGPRCSAAFVGEEGSLPPCKHHTCRFLFSLDARQRKRVREAACGYWSVEARNHYKRDASAWREDGHRHRKANGALNLALTRNVLLVMIPFEEGEPLAQFFDVYHRHPSQAIRLILGARPVLQACQPNALLFPPSIDPRTRPLDKHLAPSIASA